jgi:hypothetical protein
VIALATPTLGIADTFNYEMGAAYHASNNETDTTLSFPDLTGGTITIRTNSKFETNETDLFGTWYFSGVSSNEGPRSRAAFLDRASSLSFRYSRLDGDSSLRVESSDPGIADPGLEKASISGDRFSANARYVWAGSGWYVLGSVATASIEIEDDVDADAYSIGVGKYLGSRTAIDLSVLHENAESSFLGSRSSSTARAALLTFTHIGDLGSRWQYGTDVALSTDGVGQSAGSFDLRLSLFPTRSVAFGFDVGGQLEDFGDGVIQYEAFASWFLRESLEINARYGWATFDEPPGTDSDGDSAGIGIRFRF